jgi:hypothetical protein
MIDVLAGYLVPCAGTPLAQLAQLVLRVLALVVGRNPGVDSYAHLLPLLLRD